jgi:hypothetical protein
VGRKRSLPTSIGIWVVACDSARTHVTCRPARPGESSPRSGVVLKKSMYREFDDTPKGYT